MSVLCKFSNHELFVDKIQRYFQTSLQTSVVAAIEDCITNRNESWTNIFFLPAESFQNIWFASQLCCLSSFVFVARSLIRKDATALQKVVLKSEMKIKSTVRGRGGDKKGSQRFRFFLLIL